MKSTKGFTLIELLVVIAIIGILSSVVLASLNSARAKGADAATKANIANSRSQAEIFFDTNNTYVGVCGSANGGISTQLLGAASSSGAIATSTGPVSATIVSCSATSVGYAISAPLKSVSGTYYCADYTGKTYTGPTAIAANAILCP